MTVKEIFDTYLPKGKKIHFYKREDYPNAKMTNIWCLSDNEDYEEFESNLKECFTKEIWSQVLKANFEFTFVDNSIYKFRAINIKYRDVIRTHYLTFDIEVR